MKYLVIAIALLLTTTIASVYAQTPPPLNKALDNSTENGGGAEEPKPTTSLGKISIPLSDRDTLEIDIPFKNGDTYRIITK